MSNVTAYLESNRFSSFFWKLEINEAFFDGFLIKIAFVVFAIGFGKCKGELSCVAITTLACMTETILLIQYIYQESKAGNLSNCYECILGATPILDSVSHKRINMEVECRFVLIYFIFAIPLRVLVMWNLIKKHEKKPEIEIWNNVNNLPTIAGKKVVKGKEVTFIRDTSNQALFKGILEGYRKE